MTKEEAIKICNAIVYEPIITVINNQPVFDITPINVLLRFLQRTIGINYDSVYFNPYKSDLKESATFLREIADALYPLDEIENGNQDL